MTFIVLDAQSHEVEVTPDVVRAAALLKQKGSGAHIVQNGSIFRFHPDTTSTLRSKISSRLGLYKEKYGIPPYVALRAPAPPPKPAPPSDENPEELDEDELEETPATPKTKAKSGDPEAITDPAVLAAIEFGSRACRNCTKPYTLNRSMRVRATYPWCLKCSVACSVWRLAHHNQYPEWAVEQDFPGARAQVAERKRLAEALGVRYLQPEELAPVPDPTQSIIRQALLRSAADKALEARIGPPATAPSPEEAPIVRAFALPPTPEPPKEKPPVAVPVPTPPSSRGPFRLVFLAGKKVSEPFACRNCETSFRVHITGRKADPRVQPWCTTCRRAANHVFSHGRPALRWMIDQNYPGVAEHEERRRLRLLQAPAEEPAPEPSPPLSPEPVMALQAPAPVQEPEVREPSDLPQKEPDSDPVPPAGPDSRQEAAPPVSLEPGMPVERLSNEDVVILKCGRLIGVRLMLALRERLL